MKIQTIQWETLPDTKREGLLSRPVQKENSNLTESVRKIIQEVKFKKDSALLAYTEKFDKVQLSFLKVTQEEVKDAYTKVNPQTLEALKEAIRRIRLFHEAQYPKAIDLETSAGVRCERRFLPIKRVGLYVPAGTAPLPSTVLMLGVPSQVAGCPIRILMTPPQPDGCINPVTLVAADLLDIKDIFKGGGAQAIAAMAYGTESIPKVDKIFGPGNSWVTEAKLQVAQDPQGATCDLPAGPSEVMVLADESANPDFIAADLLSQAEHGPDSQVILVSTSSKLIDQTLKALEWQLEELPRKEIASEALSKSLLIQVPLLKDALEICNAYAPEHLILQLTNAREFSTLVENAGSVFIGSWTPESAGDYASGTNHVLPTYGFAKTLGGLSTESFMKSITFQELSIPGLKQLGPTVEELAATEKLDGHKNAVRIRLQALQKLQTLQEPPSPQKAPTLQESQSSITSLARPSIIEMKAYESARSLTTEGRLFLDANESPESPLPGGLNRYPEPQPRALLERFSKIYGVTQSKIQIGRGSDEAIDLLIRTFCEAGQDQILICPPTYGMYEVSAKIQGAKILRVPLLLKNGEFFLNEEEILKAAQNEPRLKIIFLCSPNNPTGTGFDLQSLLKICETKNQIVVIDEAYIEFSDQQTQPTQPTQSTQSTEPTQSSQPSLVQKLAQFPNLVILRTLSKAWASAGIRCGVAMANEEVIQLLQKVRAPYPLSGPAIEMILQATDEKRQKALQARITSLKKEREKLVVELQKLPDLEYIYPSETNFILTKWKDSQKIMNLLKSKGIIVRDRSKEPLLQNCIRITVGTPEENNQLLFMLQNRGGITIGTEVENHQPLQNRTRITEETKEN